MPSVPYPDLDPYKTLNLETNVSDDQIKKAYRKQCLIHHPDKLLNKTAEEQEKSKEEFSKIQFAFYILSDDKRKKRYDTTGSLEDSEVNDDFDWGDYFDGFKVEINEETIAQDKKQYVGSEEEKQDIVHAWNSNNGDFNILFEWIPHTEINEHEQERLIAIVDGLIADKKIKSNRQYAGIKKIRKRTWPGLRSKMKLTKLLL